LPSGSSLRLTTIFDLEWLRLQKNLRCRLPRSSGRARFHVRHLNATVTVASAKPSGCNDDGDTKYETCGRKGAQNGNSSRAFLTLCHVIRHCRLPLQSKQSSVSPSSNRQRPNLGQPTSGSALPIPTSALWSIGKPLRRPRDGTSNIPRAMEQKCLKPCASLALRAS
jgi:hypothetical protein